VNKIKLESTRTKRTKKGHPESIHGVFMPVKTIRQKKRINKPKKAKPSVELVWAKRKSGMHRI